jgi:hypothetical protein
MSASGAQAQLPIRQVWARKAVVVRLTAFIRVFAKRHDTTGFLIWIVDFRATMKMSQTRLFSAFSKEDFQGVCGAYNRSLASVLRAEEAPVQI